MIYKARIKFDNREWLVIDNFEYKNVKYYYIIEDVSEEINKLKNIEEYDNNFKAEFIYKLENGQYKNVTDQKLVNELLAEAGKRIVLGKNKVET